MERGRGPEPADRPAADREAADREAADREAADREAADPELHARLDRELRVARQVQRRLVEVTLSGVPGWETACEYQPAREIGGDFFDVFPLFGPGAPWPAASTDRLGVVIADVSGKGISAALLMAFVRPVMRSALDRSGDPVAALERTNRILADERRTGLFVTALAAVIETASGRVRYASAGHEPPIRVPAEGPPIVLEGARAPLLGAFEPLHAEPGELELGPGEALVLYTDGVTDARDASGARFGEDRLLDALSSAAQRTPAGLRAAVVDAVRAFAGAAGETDPADDLALLVVGRLRRRGGRPRAGRPGR